MESLTESLNSIKLDSSDVIDTAPVVDSIERIVLLVIVPTAVLGALLMILYILHLIQTRRVNRAILQMQKDLQELNERDRARTSL